MSAIPLEWGNLQEQDFHLQASVPASRTSLCRLRGTVALFPWIFELSLACCRQIWFVFVRGAQDLTLVRDLGHRYWYVRSDQALAFYVGLSPASVIARLLRLVPAHWICRMRLRSRTAGMALLSIDWGRWGVIGWKT